MKKDTYHLFAEEGNPKGYGLPKVHVITSGIKLDGEWENIVGIMKKVPNLENMVAVYEVPANMKSMKMYRDLTPKEIETWIKDLAQGSKDENYTDKRSTKR
ncbi:MAG: hypothetical protein V1645_03485 [archaeon]